MDIKKSKELVISTISEVLKNKGEVSEDTHLIGEKSQLDSMNLVEICLILADLADEHGFEFNWTFEAGMSKFRSVTTLAEEFASQSET